ncbi:hypothetical protein K2173_013119 [Erythroxylum novogranatense]|uniref:Kinesin-like protein n=1 Tax=Erythroxylum novogranatense TaxID=1862640 RepID=A0AAV8S714_9ROSI|nr:hypothetical protein K2173_013119 [Erythroxylum novogranatense]
MELVEEFMDSMLCVPGSRLIQSGLVITDFTEKPVMFVNSGGEALQNMRIEVEEDRCFQGGDVLRTDEIIANAGDFPSFYQSARFGDFCYEFVNLLAGEYVVDLHFAEIVNTNGPKGMRVFDVFVQEEKIISELDIYSIIGANKALQLVDLTVNVGEDGVICLRFKGVVGSPIISGICIKQATDMPNKVEQEHVTCNNCAAEIKFSRAESKSMRMNSLAKYEKRIEELKAQYQLKADECYEAWMSLTAANQQLEKVSMELDNRFFENMCLDQTLQKQTVKLRDISSQYEQSKEQWATSINRLEYKIKMMKIKQSLLSTEARECAGSIPELNKMIFAAQALVAQYGNLKLKFNDEQVKRKELYNQLQESKGNIRVFCRCRPLNKEEISAGYHMVVDLSNAKDGDLGVLTSSTTKKMFKFDRVFTPKDNQVDVFTNASSMVVSVLDGYNVCIFAYGQTGTGKTFTMEGTSHDRGVNYRTLQQLFKIVGEREETISYDISVSVLEVYNEQIRDLLALSPTGKRLEIKQVSEGVHHVPGTVEAKVENIEEFWDLLQVGSKARVVGSNNVNEHSSRSHCMICTMVRAKNLINGECTSSKLWLVDLAGSERLAKTEVQGERLKEAQNINRSLSALGDVISALATKSNHIPYRNSKLTHLLQDALGGDSKTLMFVQISPLVHDLSETLTSLNFATRVRGVQLGPPKKQIDMCELQKLKLMHEKAKQELRCKDDAMRKLEDSFQNLEGKAKGKDQICRNQQEKIDELENLLASRTELCRHLDKQLSQLSEEMRGKEEICSNFQHKVKELENKLKEQKQAKSMNLQYKVKELENRERSKEFELHSRILQQKVRELENKLMCERENSEPRLLHQKIKVLEEKLIQYESHGGESIQRLNSRERLRATPVERKVMTTLCDIDPPSQRSLNSNSQTVEECSVLLKGTDSLREIRRKRDIQSKGAENNNKFSFPTPESKGSRGLERITRKRNNGINRDQQALGAKDTNRLKIWLR